MLKESGTKIGAAVLMKLRTSAMNAVGFDFEIWGNRSIMRSGDAGNYKNRRIQI
jgi:hypothetical protein